MPRIKPPEGGAMDIQKYLRNLYLRTEHYIISEIIRKRAADYVDYAEVAALERTQETLQSMVDESWKYAPKMIEKIFYKNSAKHAAGYANARNISAFTPGQQAIMEQLSYNLLGEISQSAEIAMETVKGIYGLGRLESDPFRRTILSNVAAQQAAGIGTRKAAEQAVKDLTTKGLTGFVDKAGREWSLSNYCDMATRTTARQAEVAAILSKDDHDLYKISNIGSTCPLCAVYEGRVYSKSGTNPNYPPLTLAFGKVDPAGPDDLTNSYLNIHPNCLHTLMKFTEYGKTEAELKKIRDFSNPETNPLNHDPRTKKQIEAYRTKQRNRAKLLREKKKVYEVRMKKEEAESFLNETEGEELKNEPVEAVEQNAETTLGQHKKGKKVLITEQSVDKVRKVKPYGFTEENAATMQKAHKDLLDFSRTQNNSNEVATLIDLNTNERLPFIKGNVDDLNIDADPDAFHWIRGGEKRNLALLHNHPGLSDFSSYDVWYFLKNDAIKTMTIVTNRGKIRYISKKDGYRKKDAFKWIQEHDISNKKEAKKTIESFLKQCYNFGIERR